MSRPTTLPAPSRPRPPRAALPRRPGRLSPAPALWFCVYLPELALRARGMDPEEPGVVFETAKGRALVYEASPVTRAAGVHPGMPLAQARALYDNLPARERRPAAERRILRRLAGRMTRFTPTVGLAPPHALLLEVRASLRLFGGEDNLRKALEEELAAEFIRADVAAAPTPLAALWLAGQGRNRIVADESALRSALGTLPVTVLPLPPDRLRSLAEMGVLDLRDLWRLPRDGLARRFGPQLLLAMDRALGRTADPQTAFEPPERFEAIQELPWEVDNTALLMPAVERLISRLCRFLRDRDAGISRFRLELRHGRTASRVVVGLRLATRDRLHLMRLIETHLDRLRLPAPVEALGLLSGPLQPFPAENSALALLPPAPSPSRERGETPERDWQCLLEQLEARLGAGRLRFLEVREDHRPERAFAWRETPAASAGPVSKRPLWLLPRPRPLGSRPRVVAGPERVEGGWWDGEDRRRDYYIAKGSDDRRLWVFRDLDDGNWYLHGLFD